MASLKMSVHVSSTVTRLIIVAALTGAIGGAMVVCAVLLLAAVSTVSARLYVIDLDDGAVQRAVSAARVRRSPGHHEGVTGPVHTFVKTDKHANFKWGVKHHVGKEYAG